MSKKPMALTLFKCCQRPTSDLSWAIPYRSCGAPRDCVSYEFAARGALACVSRGNPGSFVDEEVASAALGSEVAFAHRSGSFRYFSATSLGRARRTPTFTIAVGNRSVAASG